VTSERVLGRLGMAVSFSGCIVAGEDGSYYFSTHGCRRLDSDAPGAAFEELLAAAVAWRAFRLKKSAMVLSVGYGDHWRC